MAKTSTIVGLGELLWDFLPTARQLGGAPANFAYMSHLLGNDAIVASRIGQDDLGREAADRLKSLGLDVSHLQKDASHPTGTVAVQVRPGGQPRFTIHEHVAWDVLEWSPKWEKLAATADAVCFGTLAQRSRTSRDTIMEFLKRTKAVRIFDVNLRQHFYSAAIVRASIAMATIVKMNACELPIILKLLGLPRSKNGAKRLLEFGPKLVCVTRGSRGSVLLAGRQILEHPGFQIRVADTVGSGDAFTAGLVHEYLRGSSLERMSDTANRLGSWVATQSGGTPATTMNDLRRALKALEVGR
jgi:fructokinase